MAILQTDISVDKNLPESYKYIFLKKKTNAQFYIQDL
jgi:hypothetical protein